MVKATLRAIHSEEEYEAELAKCVGVTGYHRWFFMKAVSESADFHMRTFAVEKDGSAIGVLPILLRRRGPVSTVNYSPVSRLDPLLSDPTFMSDVLAAADRYLRRKGLRKQSFCDFHAECVVAQKDISDASDQNARRRHSGSISSASKKKRWPGCRKNPRSLPGSSSITTAT